MHSLGTSDERAIETNRTREGGEYGPDSRLWNLQTLHCKVNNICCALQLQATIPARTSTGYFALESQAETYQLHHRRRSLSGQIIINLLALGRLRSSGAVIDRCGRRGGKFIIVIV